MTHATRSPSSSSPSLPRSHALVTLGALVTLSAVHGCAAAPPRAPAGTPTGQLPDQQARGAEVFSTSCANCHGDKGQGGKGDAPPVMGAGALPLDAPKSADDRKAVKFNTARDVFAFTKQYMPDHHGGTLTDQQYWDVTAFILMGRGVPLGGKTVDESTAPGIVVNP